MSSRQETRVSFVLGVRVVEVSGEIDIANVRALSESLEAEREHAELVLSLEGVHYIDSSGLTALIREHKQRTAASRIFEITQLTEFLASFSDLPAAVEAAKT